MLPGSVIIKGKSLNILSSQEGRAAGLHKKKQQPPTAPLQALRGHNTRERLLCPPKRQLSYHLGAAEGAGGEKCTRSRESTNFSSLEKSPHWPSTPAPEGTSSKESGGV